MQTVSQDDHEAWARPLQTQTQDTERYWQCDQAGPAGAATICDDELFWGVADHVECAEPPDLPDVEPSQEAEESDPAPLDRFEGPPDSEGDLVTLEEIKDQILANFKTSQPKPGSKSPKSSQGRGRNPRPPSRSPTRSQPSCANSCNRTQKTLTASARPTSAHERLYQRSTRAHQRQVESREEEKLAKEKAWRPQLREDGPAAEACRRLHHGTQRKEEELLRIRDKYGKEFASMAPFSPSLSERGSPVPRKKFQDWVRDQEAWRTTRDEKRAERVKGQAEEEANYFKQHSVHRELSNKDMTKATKAVDRLYSSHKKSKEKIEKLRSEKMQQELEHIQQASVHRRVDTPDASEKIQKVQSSINRLYHQATHPLEPSERDMEVTGNWKQPWRVGMETCSATARTATSFDRVQFGCNFAYADGPP
ncbi:unnamed protein product [Cladocopium goreaui]|uniref:Uncharacterized protein n=1 Tax=Cladocopium goreaui TaxID=2562237 RepID=A0A9P1GGC2_9DINO|nr:unnamed protein product [Cladocopium goreaui]